MIIYDIYKINLIHIVRLVKRNKEWGYIFYGLAIMILSLSLVALDDILDIDLCNFFGKSDIFTDKFISLVNVILKLICNIIALPFVVGWIMAQLLANSVILYFVFFITVVKKLKNKSLFSIFYFLFVTFHFLFFIFYFLFYDQSWDFEFTPNQHPLDKNSYIPMAMMTLSVLFMIYYLFINKALKIKYFFAFMVSLSFFTIFFYLSEELSAIIMKFIYLIMLVLSPAGEVQDLYRTHNFQDPLYLIPFVFFILQLLVEAYYLYKKEKPKWIRYKRMVEYKIKQTHKPHFV
jgi:hypothetical protein